jgi:hypothetical protein
MDIFQDGLGRLLAWCWGDRIQEGSGRSTHHFWVGRTNLMW